MIDQASPTLNRRIQAVAKVLPQEYLYGQPVHEEAAALLYSGVGVKTVKQAQAMIALDSMTIQWALNLARWEISTEFGSRSVPKVKTRVELSFVPSGGPTP